MSKTNIEQSFVAIKPDAVQRGLTSELINRFEQKGLKLIGLKMVCVTNEMAHQHYAEHIGKDFFPGLLSFITSGPIIAMVWEGRDAVAVCRRVIGNTDPEKAEPGTIRFDFGQAPQRNVIHGCDSIESAAREIAIYFQPHEVYYGWERDIDKWIVPNLV
jgi:nucleoside-diphosphate kinase